MDPGDAVDLVAPGEAVVQLAEHVVLVAEADCGAEGRGDFNAMKRRKSCFL